MNTKEEILDKHFSMKDREIEKWKVLAAMEEYAAQFKDSPYQGSAGVWVKASERLPEFVSRDKSYVVRYVMGNHPFEIWNWDMLNDREANGYVVEWLDDSTAAPAGDGLKQHAIAFAEFVDSRFVSDDHNDDMYWDNDGEQYTREMLYTEFMKPTPPNKSV